MPKSKKTEAATEVDEATPIQWEDEASKRKQEILDASLTLAAELREQGVTSEEPEDLQEEDAESDFYPLSRCEVTFLMNVTDVDSLTEALDVAAVSIARYGLDSFQMLATDPDTGRRWLVHHGEITDADKTMAEVERQHDEQMAELDDEDQRG